MKIAHLIVAALALAGRTVHCQEDDDYGEDEGGGDVEDNYGGGGDDDYGEGGGESPPASGSVQEISSVEEFESFIDDADASVIGAFAAKEVKDPEAKLPEGWDTEEDGEWEAPTIENPAVTSFNSITGSAYNYRFAITYEPAVLAVLKQKSKSGLYLYRSPKFLSKEHGDRARERYPSDKLSTDGVTNWLNAKAQPLVGQFSTTTQQRYKGPVLVVFMNLDFEQNAKSVNYVLKRARKAAVGYKGKLSVAVASSSDMSYDLADYGLKSKSPKSEILMGIRADGKYYGAADIAFSAAAMTKFADDFLAGKVPEAVRLEPDTPDPPPDDDADMGYNDESDGDGEPMRDEADEP